MDEKDLPSSSDESDADFIPKEEDNKSDSGSEFSDSISSGDENERISRKRKKYCKRGTKKLRSGKKDGQVDEQETQNDEEKSEIDIDSLYADFKKDVNSKVTTTRGKEESQPVVPDAGENQLEEKKSLVNSIARGIPRGRGCGLSGVLSQIGKKDKMSTLQKSQLDWNNFKKSEGIEEEIKMHNRGKDGYLEKQDFLQRTDIRQFEIEKDLRSARRKF